MNNESAWFKGILHKHVGQNGIVETDVGKWMVYDPASKQMYIRSTKEKAIKLCDGIDSKNRYSTWVFAIRD